MTTTISFDIKNLLELEQPDVNLFRSQANQPNHVNALFGGQMLGQGLKAAAMISIGTTSFIGSKA